MLTASGADATLAQALLPLPSAHPPCSADRAEENGWSLRGFVFADPLAGPLAPEELRRCLVAGFDYLLGVPTAGGGFDIGTFPEPAVSLVLLDYLRQCAHAGKTDHRPPLRSNRGSTTLPSLSCIRAGIMTALDG